jgi:hypothetical protein
LSFGFAAGLFFAAGFFVARFFVADAALVFVFVSADFVLVAALAGNASRGVVANERARVASGRRDRNITEPAIVGRLSVALCKMRESIRVVRKVVGLG